MLLKVFDTYIVISSSILFAKFVSINQITFTAFKANEAFKVTYYYFANINMIKEHDILL